MLRNLSIRLKLVLLAGVPVLGAMALASLLWLQAQQSAKAAEALGSVEDLAKLSAGISDLVHDLQSERALLGSVLGHNAAIEEATEDAVVAAHTKAQAAARTTLKRQYTHTDAARQSLQAFLGTRDLSALPPRLSSSLAKANKELDRLAHLRESVYGGDDALTATSEYFANTNNTLIGATAALTRLSDDGEMLRSISGLVSLMQVNERASQEHALLTTVFAAGAFPPGTYRSLVKLITQQKVYVEVFRANSRDDQMQMYQASVGSELATQAMAMRTKALATVDDEFAIASAHWFVAQAHKLQSLYKLEAVLTETVRSAALAKVKDIESSMRTTSVLSVTVLLISTLLGLLIARGVDGSVRALSVATEIVQRDKDFSIRAVKASNDELGQLTDAFNAMLTDIQKRDGELAEYRQTLEDKVEERTAALSVRNEAMRVVLDNVEQGLATVCADGSLDSERSAIFDTWFGAPANDVAFGTHLCKDDEVSAAMLDIGWSEVMEGFLPTELTIMQMPSSLQIGDKHFTLSYKPTVENDAVVSALLVVSDVTEEVARRAEEVRQREFISIFERVMKDKNGFVEFFNETKKLVLGVFERASDRNLMMRDIHTIKGNCGLYGVTSVAAACHALETAVAERRAYPSELDVQVLRGAWRPFEERVRSLVSEERDDIVEVAHYDLDQVIASVRRLTPHWELTTQLERLKYEPIEKRFDRVMEQAMGLAKKLGKPAPRIVIQANNLRFPAVHWTGFWAAFSHVLRNAIDHGLETQEQRQGRGKPGPGLLRLAAVRTASSYIVELQDDGNGINWGAVRHKALTAGLAVDSYQDLVAALFSDGVSTQEEVTDTSGRGVGMGAVMQATLDMKGTIEVDSEMGKGTTFRFKFPLSVGEMIGYRPRIVPKLG